MNLNPRRAMRPTRPAPRALLALALALSVTAIGVVASGVEAAAPPAPSASTTGASGVSYSTATLHGYVNPHGQATDYVFQYGTSRAYGSQTPLAPAGSGTSSIQVTQTVSGLQPLKTYHYRILATSPGGATAGGDHTFTTPKIPLSVAIVGIPNPVVYGNTAFVEGTLSGTEAANHLVQLEANPFPYVGGFKVVGNAERTNTTGGFSFALPGLLENTQIRVVTLGKPLVSSPVLVEGVAVRVTLHARATGRRGFARLYGTVTPAEVGALVGFQLLKPGHRSVNVGGTVVKHGTSSASRFSRVVRVHRGLYKALIKVFDGAHTAGYSAPVLIR
jgi:hypothetical protein